VLSRVEPIWKRIKPSKRSDDGKKEADLISGTKPTSCARITLLSFTQITIFMEIF
jgi:hypothetical protein